MTNKNRLWYSEETGFFGPDYLIEYGDQLPLVRTLTEVDFIEQKMSLQRGMRILDIPCGHGRHMIELGKRGYEMTGVDLNTFFLKKAQEEADAQGVKMRLQQGDMRNISFENEFDVALNLFTALGYFEEDEDDRKVFAGVLRSLKSGGQFLVDFMNRDRLIRNFRKNDWRALLDGSVILYDRNYDPIRGRNDDQRIRIKRGEEPQVSETRLRIYTPTELVKMAESVGFTFKEAYGDFDGTPLTMESRRVILIFLKS